MPSKEQRELAQHAIGERAGNFRSALVDMAEQVRNLVQVAQGVDNQEKALADQESSLGSFAENRIDVELFSQFTSSPTTVLPSDQIAPVEAALSVINELLAEENLFGLHVEEGQSLGSALARKYGSLGRVFGAAQVIEFVKTGQYEAEKHAHLLEQLPFAQWSAGQRAAAPPLVVELAGGDLRAASLTNFLDGGVKLVLLVEGDAPPAALARVVTPGVFAQQSIDASPLETFTAFEGAGVAALFSAPVASFVHDPAGGDTSFQRFTQIEIPEASKLVRVGSVSASQQKEELALLEVLTAKPATAEAGEASANEVDPAGRLSAWLLSQAELSNVSA